jgi:hypothetical protein
MMPLIVGKIYVHLKTGTRYRLLAVGKHVKTLEEFVVYEALYDNPVSKVWIRSKESFLGEAKTPEGGTHPRFSIESDEA